MEQIIFLIIQLLVTVIAFLLGKYVIPKKSSLSTIQTLSQWAYKFVVSAKNMFEDTSGEDKREYVTTEIKKVCDKLKIKLTDEQIRALIEDAYDLMQFNTGGK